MEKVGKKKEQKKMVGRRVSRVTDLIGLVNSASLPKDAIRLSIFLGPVF